MAEEGRGLPALPRYAQLPVAVRQVALLVGLAAAVAAGVALALWSRTPDYAPLYSGLADRDAADIVSLLDTAKIPYKLEPGSGSLMVPADRKYDARMQLAAAGLPHGTGFGVEDLPGQSSLGQTPFMENALYMHALETELGRTIASMQPVQSARVHLAVPPESVFVRERREPTASVLLTLYPGRRLERGQVQAVVHLVASSVPELAPEHVTVVDQSGSLLTEPQRDTAMAMTNTQFEYRAALERTYAERIENLLSSAVGPGNVRASVAADLDFTVNEQTRESYDPNVSVVRSEQTHEETRSGDELAQGVPGALSNQPRASANPGASPTAAPAPAATAAAGGAARAASAGAAGSAAAAPPTDTSRSAVRNFELDKTVSHTKQAIGTVKRLSIAVLIDDSGGARGAPGGAAAGAAGAAKPLGQDQLDALTKLAREAVGFDAARGDTIEVLNATFQTPAEAAPLPAVKLWQQPWVLSLARDGLAAGLVLVLALVIVRPMMRALTRPLPAPGRSPDGMLTVGEGAQVLPARAPLPVGYDDRIAAARNAVGQDPRQVAQVVRAWVAEDNG